MDVQAFPGHAPRLGGHHNARQSRIAPPQYTAPRISDSTALAQKMKFIRDALEEIRVLPRKIKGENNFVLLQDQLGQQLSLTFSGLSKRCAEELNSKGYPVARVYLEAKGLDFRLGSYDAGTLAFRNFDMLYRHYLEGRPGQAVDSKLNPIISQALFKVSRMDRGMELLGDVLRRCRKRCVDMIFQGGFVRHLKP